MSGQELEPKEIEIEVTNIGGIDEVSANITPGVTVLAGRNATNRTSFLQAIMAALGSDDVSVKADADEAHVTLTIGDETYTRQLERANGSIRTGGDPYLEEPLLAELFAFLLESNDARRAVVTDTDLRDLIMRPIDTDEIQAEIERLIDERRRINEELDEIASLKKRLPSLEEDRTRIESEIESTKERLAETEAELESYDDGVEQTRAEQNELEEKLTELQDRRGDLESVRYELETEKESLESLQREKRTLADEADDLPDTPMGDHDEIESRIDRLRTRKQRLESEITDLQSVIQFNEEMLEDPENGLLDGTTDENGDSVTDQLLPDDSVTCWTCGSVVDAEQIESTLSLLREQSQEKFNAINEIDDELDALTDRRSELRDKQRERERIERRQTEVAEEIENTEEAIERLSERRDSLRTEISALEEDVEAQEEDMQEEVLELHREANQYEYDLGKLENQIEGIDDEIEEIETRLESEAELESERDAIKDEIGASRTKIKRIERTAVEEFNEHMDTVLERLGYGNIERVWLDRTETDVRRGRRKERKSVFDLNIARQTKNGTTYKDTVDHLSESEREVVGLVFALAGYLVHEVYETVPFLLLDSLEAIDSERIATLIEYLHTYSPYLVVALLDEDASALSDDYQYISSI
ncbi:archaea-specific SMC-related protein [Natronorubrum sp. FCH18a]|uniref:archaea-specific SMC-related protein n=1 Tax=Natronorubrum sp. FCH18a TaxID=3447018 RepID=UPI003F518A13